MYAAMMQFLLHTKDVHVKSDHPIYGTNYTSHTDTIHKELMMD